MSKAGEDKRERNCVTYWQCDLLTVYDADVAVKLLT